MTEANKPERSYPRAPQIEANPAEAERYIASLVDENAELLAACKLLVASWMPERRAYALGRLADAREKAIAAIERVGA